MHCIEELKTQNNTQIRKLCSREDCGVVVRREVDGKKIERKPRLKKKKKRV